MLAAAAARLSRNESTAVSRPSKLGTGRRPDLDLPCRALQYPTGSSQQRSLPHSRRQRQSRDTTHRLSGWHIPRPNQSSTVWRSVAEQKKKEKTMNAAQSHHARPAARARGEEPDDPPPPSRIIFIFNIFKLFLKLTLFFFKTNTFGHVCLHGAANSRCHAMHGGAAGASQRLRRPLTWQV